MSDINNQQAEAVSLENHLIDFMHDEGIDIIYDNSIEPYYSTLLSIFPNVHSRHIRQICDNPPFKMDDSNVNDNLQMFINHLLSYDNQTDVNSASDGTNYLNDTSNSEAKTEDEILTQMLQEQDQQIMEIEKQNEERTNDLLFSEFLKRDEETIDEKMHILENILPDADPAFLKKFVAENHENAMSLEQFVESSLINKNYEKRDKYFARVKAKEKIAQYTTNFSVEEFVKQFPEPFEYFENAERQAKFEEQIFNCLKLRYPNYSVQYLSYVYTANNFNLSLADKQIQSALGCDDANLLNIQIDNTALLQEIAFIQNKHSIKEHLDHVKEEEEKEFQVLREKKLLLECQCCYDELKPTACIECDNGHIFCRKCIIKGTNLAISNSQTSLKCFVGCNKEINLNVLRQVLPDSMFEMFLKKRQEAEVEAAQLEGLITCPFCPYQMELAPQIKIFTCKNPECMKITCRMCRKMNHLPIRCEDVLDEHKGRLYIEEEMSKALIRNCNRCQRPFVKSIGCNTMTCICGATMCYICRKPYTRGISHMNCGRYHDSRTFDRLQVESRRAEATAKLHSDFPDLNIPKV